MSKENVRKYLKEALDALHSFDDYDVGDDSMYYNYVIDQLGKVELCIEEALANV